LPLSVLPPRHLPQQVDQNTRQQLDRIVTTYVDDWNKHDAAGVAGLYTKDGVLVSQAPKVVKTGLQELSSSLKLRSKHSLIMMGRQSTKFHHLEPTLFSPWANTI
jgi:ketosteroid isomerase-like protein